VFTGTGRRRAWAADEKARIIAESYAGGETVSAVARRHGLTPQQLFGWRREARQRAESEAGEISRAFTPVRGIPAALGCADCGGSSEWVADGRDRDRCCHGSDSARD
jgi:Transposase